MGKISAKTSEKSRKKSEVGNRNSGDLKKSEVVNRSSGKKTPKVGTPEPEVGHIPVHTHRTVECCRVMLTSEIRTNKQKGWRNGAASLLRFIYSLA